MNKNNLSEFDKVYKYEPYSGHYYCKDCGNNYLLKEHKDNCKFKKQGIS